MPSMVVVPTTSTARRVLLDQVHSVVSNRIRNNEEQYLVRWKTDTAQEPPLSWHNVNELVRCLEFVQDYLETRAKARNTSLPVHLAKKRKSPDSITEYGRRPSPIDRRLQSADNSASNSATQPHTSRSPSVASTIVSPQVDIYNGVLDYRDHFIFARSSSRPDIPRLSIREVPTPEMQHTALRSKTEKAEILIRAEYTRRLSHVPGERIHLVNIYDSTTPSLRFRYITDYILRQGVYKADIDTQQGCTQCSPHMGRDIGCEYTKKCDCLEYAAVDESRLTPEQKSLYTTLLQTGGSTIGLPKKFPYYAPGVRSDRIGCLVPFYLHSRRPIYECNSKCHCGPHCRNKNVQFGRTTPLEIFKTGRGSGRGWGLRCRQPLHEGQFIDTYRGEIITDAEATRREQQSASSSSTTGSKSAKASYLYSLDKFAESEGLQPEDIYVVDGEFMGGPTKFMNHSCEPNCRQYTVSYNKHDCRVYDIAFFACRDIPAGEELTFDYLDKEEGVGEEEEEEEPGEDAIPCLCGAAKCRKWLWT